jgi:endonuclease YncB( thermonuclease family)
LLLINLYNIPKWLASYALIVSVLFVSLSVQAGTISGKVISIADGDTLTILDHSKRQIKIRLAAIDAPERSQPFGNRSRQSLSDICHQKLADVAVVDTDRYGRSVGVVSCEGVQANEAQVQSGMAWVYRKHAKGFAHLHGLEDKAKAARRGLWSDPSPVPPWEWRRAKRNAT